MARFRITLLTSYSDLYIQIFGHTNYGGAYNYLKFDFDTQTFSSWSGSSSSNFGCGFFAFPLTFIPHEHFFNNAQNLTKKEKFAILSYILLNIHSKNCENLCYKIQNSINKFENKNIHLFCLNCSYHNVFIGHLFINYDKVCQEIFVYNSEKVCFIKKQNNNDLPTYSLSYALPDISMYIKDDVLNLPDNKLFEFLHLAKLY